jgi:hypothetical protein
VFQHPIHAVLTPVYLRILLQISVGICVSGDALLSSLLHRPRRILLDEFFVIEGPHLSGAVDAFVSQIIHKISVFVGRSHHIFSHIMLEDVDIPPESLRDPARRSEMHRIIKESFLQDEVLVVHVCFASQILLHSSFYLTLNMMWCGFFDLQGFLKSGRILIPFEKWCHLSFMS